MKTFRIEAQNEERQPHYKDQILRIINDHETTVRAVSPSLELEAVTQVERDIFVEGEIESYAEVRKDVCESFGVSADKRHIYIHEQHHDIPANSKKRTVRAFVVVIDVLMGENFYGEGRTWHIELFNELVKRINRGKVDFGGESVFYGEQKGPSRYLFFKGFIDKDDFKGLSADAGQVLRTPIFDTEGKEIETPSNWFLTAHNLEGQQGVSK